MRQQEIVLRGSYEKSKKIIKCNDTSLFNRLIVADDLRKPSTIYMGHCFSEPLFETGRKRTNNGCYLTTEPEGTYAQTHKYINTGSRPYTCIYTYTIDFIKIRLINPSSML